MGNKLNGRIGFQESHRQGLKCLLEPCLQPKHRICFNRRGTSHSTQRPCEDSESDDHEHESPDRYFVHPEQGHLEDNEPTLGDEQEPWLEPKHNIFLSHSGDQENFIEQLCKDLERVHHFPFFDKRPDCVCKGEKFPPQVFKAAQQCRVVVLVLSKEFFTCSKWPMLELNEFVEAQESTNTRLKILPLFLGITLKQFQDAESWEHWVKVWQGWAHSDPRIDVKKWEVVLTKVVSPTNALEYDKLVGEVTFREKVVAAVCKLVQPDVKYEVSHVQALQRLCEPILQKLNGIEPHSTYGVQVVGLFGVGGVGKTTITKAMCNEKFARFDGRVCHLELGGRNLMQLRKKVLQDLTGASEEILIDDLHKLAGLLKTRMHRQKVFLCIDNVLEYQIEEAQLYLEVGYQRGSAVLVTSRSFDILKSLRMNEGCCLEMPELQEEDATNLFLHCAAPHAPLNDKERDVIKRCVEACRFSKKGVGGLAHGPGKGPYLPLALKVWGVQLGHISDDPFQWEASLRSLENHKFNQSTQPEHPLFSLLRQGYDALKTEDQHIFLDLALFVRRFSGKNVLKWLSVMYKKSKIAIEGSLQALRRKALLEYSIQECSGEPGLEFNIHDLYLEFAAEEAQAGPFDQRRILFLSEGSRVLGELMKRPLNGFWPCLERVRISNSKMQSLEKLHLHRCSNAELLQLHDCDQLLEVDVRGMDSLTCLDVNNCENLGDKFEGVEELKDLVWFRWRNICQPAPFLHDLASLTALQVLVLDGKIGKSKLYDPPNLNGCTSLRELSLSWHEKLKSFPDLSNLFRIESIKFTWCENVKEFPDLSNLSKLREIDFCGCLNIKEVIGLSSLTSLKVLNLAGCWLLEGLLGLGDLIALEMLNIEGTRVSQLNGLSKLENLQDLSVHWCRNLTSLAGLEYLTSLQHLDASWCKNLTELPNLSNLKELKKVDLSYTNISILPYDFERLARHCILRLVGCESLIEPLVIFLKEQRIQVPEGTRGLISNVHHVGKQSTDNLWANTRRDVVYYLNQAFSDFYFEYSEEAFLSSPCILGETDGGIEFVVRALFEDNNMGILSMVIAKYAATGGYWEKLTAELTALCQGILHYLDKQVDLLEAPPGNYRYYSSSEHASARARVLFILKHLSNNQSMAVALGRDRICRLIKCCISSLESDPDKDWAWMPKEFLESCANVLERCTAADTGHELREPL